MKVPAALADLSIGYLIYKIVKENRSTKAGLIATSALLFNPVLIFNSSIWGQIDAVFSLLLLVSLYLVVKERLWLAFGCLGLAFLIKPQTVLFLPLVFLYFLKKNQAVSEILAGVLVFIATIFLLSWPFFTGDPILGLPKLILRSASTYPYTSIFAMNFWGIFGTWKPDSATFLGLSYLHWGTILIFLGLILAWGLFWKAKGLSAIFLAASLVVLAFFMLPTRVHERWLYAFFPFFLVAAAQTNKWQLYFIYFLFSTIHFFNLYFVYTYYNVNFLKIEPIANFIGKYFNWFSLICVIIYLYLVILAFKKRVYEQDK
jgi:Gpi18-like mannosyltransferase